jgi:hypothetical protein
MLHASHNLPATKAAYKLLQRRLDSKRNFQSFENLEQFTF